MEEGGKIVVIVPCFIIYKIGQPAASEEMPKLEGDDAPAEDASRMEEVD